MTLDPTTAALIAETLSEHRRLAEAACQATDLEAARIALDRCWGARLRARHLITDAEKATLAAAVAENERRAA